MIDIAEISAMSENEQSQWLQKYAWYHRKESKILADYHREVKSGYCETSLADLAFRLRDEAKDKNLVNLKNEYVLIYEQVTNRYCTFIDFWLFFSKPIHGIYAALNVLEAKEQINGR